MVVNKLFRFSTIVAVILLIAACTEDDHVDSMHITKEQVEEMIENELSRGDGAESIENFLDRNGIIFSYDKYSNRYQGIVRDVSKKPNVDQAIVIHINVDKERRYISSSVYYSYTMP